MHDGPLAVLLGSHAPRGNRLLEDLRPDGAFVARDAEQPKKRSHAERGNQAGTTPVSPRFH